MKQVLDEVQLEQGSRTGGGKAARPRVVEAEAQLDDDDAILASFVKRASASGMEAEVRRMMKAFSNELQHERQQASAPFLSTKQQADVQDGDDNDASHANDIDLDDEEDAEVIATIIAQARDHALLD
jgi:hypothetical protein